MRTMVEKSVIEAVTAIENGAGADGEAGSRLLALLLQLDHLVCPLFLS